MKLNPMFKRTVKENVQEPEGVTPVVPDGLFRKCNACRAAVFVDEVKENHYICPRCQNFDKVDKYVVLSYMEDLYKSTDTQ